MIRDNWLETKKTEDGFHITIIQDRWRPLKISAVYQMFIFLFTIVWSWAAGRLEAGTIFSIALLPSIIGLFMFLWALWFGFNVSSRTAFTIKDGFIKFEISPAKDIPAQILPIDEICQVSVNGKGFLGNYVAINYKGRQIKIAIGLNEDQAIYLHQKLGNTFEKIIQV